LFFFVVKSFAMRLMFRRYKYIYTNDRYKGAANEHVFVLAILKLMLAEILYFHSPFTLAIQTTISENKIYRQ